MRLDQLLEKKEAKQLQLLKKLLLVGGKMETHELASYLGISKPSLEKYVEELQDELAHYQEQCRLYYRNGSLVFEMSPTFSLNQIEWAFYRSALKFQILEHLLQHQEVTTVQLAQKLAVSESSLFRKIKELNGLLAEFELEIWQGKLIGEETQIRYFYFELFWYVHSFDSQPLPIDEKYVGLITRGLNMRFTKEAQQRLSLWLRIMKARLKIATQSFQVLREKMASYMKDPLFQQLRELVFRGFGHYALEVREEEAMLHFVFLLSFSVLSEHDLQVYMLQRSRFTPTALTDTLILEHILHLYRPSFVPREIEATCYGHLLQIHSRVYFFKGDVEVFDRENIWQLEAQLSSRNIQQISHELLDKALAELDIKPSDKNSLLMMTMVKYLSVITIIDYQINREFRVGIALKMDELFKEALYYMWLLYLKNLNGVVVERYRPEQEYDLILANYAIETKTPTYRISELGTAYDRETIKKMIRERFQ
ncbi:MULTISPECIES: helix-turn-helix domain-containing protein [Enterococcus]|uniref:helix-turn-helix domain-containing protein n=1 Tax=Enterococcus TaxID=1350 RepID=UPI001CA82149|nr:MULTISPECIES: helix-turn-helix domain-containing protein [Enterococcus]MBZ0324349.1 helix-turn-helix domain-containing protein [Enterococcus casseliflavus]